MRFVSYRQNLEADISNAFARSVQEVEGQAKENAPVSRSAGLGLNVGDIQGGLRASITNRIEERTTEVMRAVIGSDVRHAAQREFGGPIVPVRARMLHWIDPVTGQHRVAKRVMQQPGGESNGRRPWLRPAGDRFPEFMGDHLKRGRFG